MPKPSKTGVRGLYRDQQGRYRIDLRWRDPSTGKPERFKERLPKGISAAAAKNRAKEVLSSALAGKFDPKRERPRKLHEALDEYVEWARTNRPKTARDRVSLSKTIKAYISDRKLDELAPFHVEAFKSRRTKGGTAPATVNRAVAMLKHFYGCAHQWGWVAKRQVDAIREVKLLREPPGRVRWLTDDEMVSLFASLPEALQPIVKATLLSGMRRAEVVALHKDAIDLAKRQITLRKTKNNKVRHLHVNDALVPVLEAAMARSATPFVFVGKQGRPYTLDGFSGMYRRAVKKAGIENLTFHDLRHDFASRVRRGGAGLDVIARLLGHSSLDMALRYAHLGDAQLVDAVSKLDLDVVAPSLPPGPVAEGQKILELRVVTPYK